MLCVVGLLIVFHCSEAARYDEKSGNKYDVYGVRSFHLIEKERENADSQPTRVKVITIESPRRRVKLGV